MKEILADIGNSSIAFLYTFQGKRVMKRAFSLKERKKAVSEIFSAFGKDAHFYISSVNLPALARLSDDLSSKGMSFHVIQIEERRKMAEEAGLNIGNLNELGSDLFFDALAYKPPYLIADYGTGKKLLHTDASSCFKGAMIGPGMGLSIEALFKGTDQLDKYSIEVPPSLFSLKTNECVSSDLTYGEAIKLIGIYSRLKKEEKKLKLILTGGDGKLIYQAMRKTGFLKGKLDEACLFKGMAKGLNIYNVFFKGDKKG